MAQHRDVLVFLWGAVFGYWAVHMEIYNLRMAVLERQYFGEGCAAGFGDMYEGNLVLLESV
jgi:hypothetical protein